MGLLDLFRRRRPATMPAPATPPGDVRPAAVIAAMNHQRAAAGLAPLAQDPTAMTMAVAYCLPLSRMAPYLSHGDFEVRLANDFPGHAGAENLAYGQPDAASVVAAWMASPPHRANILGPYTKVGVGSVPSPAGPPVWVAEFVS